MSISKLVIHLFPLLVLLLLPPPVRAQNEAASPLIVGTKDTPPFVIRDADGEYRGIAIELWERIAADLDVDFEYREADLQGLIDGTGDGSFDIAAAALTMTAEREASLDFSHSYYLTGLGIAVPADEGSGFVRAIRTFPYGPFLSALAALALALFIAGLLLWLVERRRNPEQFGHGVKGFGDGFWWSAVTMTTVGYGDKAPRTFAGRFIAIIWMFAGVFMISAFTASIASVLTTAQLRSDVAGPDDLPSVRVGTVADSTSEAYLNRRNIGARAYPTTLDALRALAGRDVDAVVYDAPILQYLAINDLPGRVRVLPARFEAQQYGFAFPPGSPLREQVNRLILERTGDAQWRASLKRYLGE